MGFHLHPNGGWPWDVKARELANAKANLSSTKVGGMHQGMGNFWMFGLFFVFFCLAAYLFLGSQR